jgi:phosphatidate cytidylyltransferase
VLSQRVLTAAVAVPVLVACVGWAPAWLFTAVVIALAAWAQWELYAMFRDVGVMADRTAGLALGVLVVLAFALGGAARPWTVPLALSLAVAGCLALGLRRETGAGLDWTGIALTLLGVCYCAWLLGHALWLRGLAEGRALTLFALAVTWCGESGAYFVGRRFGRHKLAPRISPGKTLEGAAAQVAVSTGAAVVAAPAAGLPAGHALAVGVLLGVVGQVGDLAESFLKRSARTKDAGRLLPGHGGLLDRLDSLLFNLPALYYYVSVFLARPGVTNP